LKDKLDRVAALTELQIRSTLDLGQTLIAAPPDQKILGRPWLSVTGLKYSTARHRALRAALPAHYSSAIPQHDAMRPPAPDLRPGEQHVGQMRAIRRRAGPIQEQADVLIGLALVDAPEKLRREAGDIGGLTRTSAISPSIAIATPHRGCGGSGNGGVVSSALRWDRDTRARGSKRSAFLAPGAPPHCASRPAGALRVSGPKPREMKFSSMREWPGVSRESAKSPSPRRTGLEGHRRFDGPDPGLLLAERWENRAPWTCRETGIRPAP